MKEKLKAGSFIILMILTIMFGVSPVFGKKVQSGQVITGVSRADRMPEWYCPRWVTHSKYSPEFEVLDTESAHGRYAPMTKAITLKDLVKFHGHACDGLIEAASALSLAFKVLFPDGVIDRTDLRVVSKNSPCYMDAAAYLTGARVNFGTLEVDNTLGACLIVQVISTGKAVKVCRKPGVFPEELDRLERKIKSGEATPEEITKARDLAWEYAKTLLSHPLEDSFTVEVLKNFTFPKSAYGHVGVRSDIQQKNAPLCAYH